MWCCECLCDVASVECTVWCYECGCEFMVCVSVWRGGASACVVLRVWCEFMVYVSVWRGGASV